LTEDIWRRIRELEERVKKFQEELKSIEEEIAAFRLKFPQYTHYQLLMINPVYAMLWGKRMSRMRWIKEWTEKIEKLKKVIPPVKFLTVSVTFSIETGKGHEIFAAEITAETIVPKEYPPEILSRIVNACIKYFFIAFDAYKDITKDKEVVWGKPVYDRMLKWCRKFMYISEIEEKNIDDFLKTLEKLGGISRPKEEYLTYESIIKIGVEEFPTEEALTFPKVNLTIEKTEVGYYVDRKVLYLSDKPEYNILDKFGIKVEEEKKK
jgi:hypothetical protein